MIQFAYFKHRHLFFVIFAIGDDVGYDIEPETRPNKPPIVTMRLGGALKSLPHKEGKKQQHGKHVTR